jgi:hypothetical protein
MDHMSARQQRGSSRAAHGLHVKVVKNHAIACELLQIRRRNLFAAVELHVIPAKLPPQCQLGKGATSIQPALSAPNHPGAGMRALTSSATISMMWGRLITAPPATEKRPATATHITLAHPATRPGIGQQLQL